MLLFTGLVMFCTKIMAQVGINTPVPNASAMLDITSTTKGVLIPRLTKAEKNTIASPATGLLIYQNSPDSIGFHYYDGLIWQWLLTASNNADSSKWKLTAGNIANKNSGNVGINTAATAPNSTLHVNGTIAVGVNMGVTGGTSAAPFSLAGSKSYIGCLPADNTNNYYQLPNPTTCEGRIYYIRNNSSMNTAKIVTAGGLIFPGNRATAVMGGFYDLNPTTSVKTVICISDGANWTISKLD